MTAPPARIALPIGAVKICGLREPAHARAAALAGADLLGMIFAPARRQVTAETAAACIQAARTAAPARRILAVGVFVNATAEELNRTAMVAGLDLLQLHGEEDPALLDELDRPVIKGLRPVPSSTGAAVDAMIARYAAAANAPLAYLIDGYHPGHYGGTGTRADWSLVAELARRWPVILSGGLDAANVATAIQSVRPRAVDVSSGVETDGVKDVGKITAFVVAAKSAFHTAEWLHE